MKTIISASIVAAAIIIYGLIQLRIADAHRYEYHERASGSQTYRSVFDRRTGRVYMSQSATYYDYVNAIRVNRKWEAVSADTDDYSEPSSDIQPYDRTGK